MAYFVVSNETKAETGIEYLAVVTYWNSDATHRTAEWVADAAKACQFGSLGELTTVLEELNLDIALMNGQIRICKDT